MLFRIMLYFREISGFPIKNTPAVIAIPKTNIAVFKHVEIAHIVRKRFDLSCCQIIVLDSAFLPVVRIQQLVIKKLYSICVDGKGCFLAVQPAGLPDTFRGSARRLQGTESLRQLPS